MAARLGEVQVAGAVGLRSSELRATIRLVADLILCMFFATLLDHCMNPRLTGVFGGRSLHATFSTIPKV